MIDPEQAIIAKLRTEGCYLDEAGCTPASLCFTFRERDYTFFLPRPGDMWNPEILSIIHAELEFLEIELLPLNSFIH